MCERGRFASGVFLDASSVFFIDLIIAGGLRTTDNSRLLFLFLPPLPSSSSSGLFFVYLFYRIRVFVCMEPFIRQFFYDSDRASHYRLQLAQEVCIDHRTREVDENRKKRQQSRSVCLRFQPLRSAKK